tara:strand:+ start:686 stop:934 length:249 start_codon:yes stop_codon:yes gene_type:complete
MKQYFKVFFYTEENKPDYWIGQANSVEDAIKKADVLPKLVYDVWLLDEWEDECDSRRGMHPVKIKQTPIDKAVCWAKGFFNK